MRLGIFINNVALDPGLYRELHDAGNISGLVYKNLWYSMLEALNRSVRVIDI